jgi:hypothetical protein
VVHTDVSCSEAHPRQEDHPQRPKVSEHLHDEEWETETWRFRNSEGSITHEGDLEVDSVLKQDHHRNSVLHLARDHQQQSVQI